MSILVMKFGGTSVGNTLKVKDAAKKAVAQKAAGRQVVVVVSAMGKMTDQLCELAEEITPSPRAQDRDLLLTIGEQQSVALMSMAISALGTDAIGLIGRQIGIITDDQHSDARIERIDSGRIRAELAEDRIVVVAGFQGVNAGGDVTTLGRGGSDTTAVALAAELNAECQIYTDVDGVFTVDPRFVPTARKLDAISYDEMLELASLGAGVMHSRSVELAKKSSVPLTVRSSLHDGAGTWIGDLEELPSVPVSGAAIVPNEARITLHGVQDSPGTALSLFSRIADANVSVDMVVQGQGVNDRADVSFTVLGADLDRTLRIAQDQAESLGASRITFDDSVAKISIVGLGMQTQTAVAARMFRALADAGVNMLMITTSTIKISVLVSSSDARSALWAVHQEFELDKAPADRRLQTAVTLDDSASDTVGAPVQTSATSVQEKVYFRDVRPDLGQALVTMSGVPDEPGFAANVFERIAGEGILVDMIVQGAALRDRTDLSFSVPRGDLERACRISRELAETLGADSSTGGTSVSDCTEVDILSVRGIGLRSHAAVAVPLFRALAGNGDDGINIRMISTSEVCVSVAVDVGRGEEAVPRLEQEFARR